MTYMHTLTALADPTRRALVDRLVQGACSVADLTKVVTVSQPAVSQHLAVLKSASLVKVEKQGAQRIYSLAPEGLIELRRYIEDLWDDVLAAYQQAAENENKGDK